MISEHYLLYAYIQRQVDVPIDVLLLRCCNNNSHHNRHCNCTQRKLKEKTFFLFNEKSFFLSIHKLASYHICHSDGIACKSPSLAIYSKYGSVFGFIPICAAYSFISMEKHKSKNVELKKNGNFLFDAKIRIGS